ncbi:COG2426 family protein [Paramaledivibacter caminithermalis]|jgi:uncharacterized membrane protein|uniref:Uncharacterized membrane protein n=1 Tax=Paramaledivibacter caminithermalis (strain DSM 15212 / CIP 107654 / DViRD3) TaxID=1121301 RepID=A0A1M6L4Q2_PARC5|nr:small multi-drug export protein [Paramaledivibacter caminithermalis]SHJ66215.1 Uncharacterized membrane protein [Paramaledivibacter caminithermalis DSM 15212]
MSLVDFLSRELKVFLLATLPVIELRGAIPYGIAMGMNPIHAAFLCVAGSMIPVPFILFFLKPFFMRLRSISMIRKFEKWLIKRTERKAKNIKKYSILGLVFFVAIPLPSTGVWTGAMAAAFLNLPIKYAFFAIFLGNIIAALLLTVLSHLAILNI